ncbi:sugar phosphate isomerase/epimerase family protein [Planctomonas psychrotolerans]|uniref:sugar phosphate isomerase/epimerase family protein n=1 Tax=Planctomonas psychrotolerans TaxID=2528712 RepID=UPI00123BD9CD|nr:sugar phosphate isomerase/epimerase family protein [Planctomonas psychrotolerans]
MALTADNWPITAALLQFPGTKRDGTVVQDAEPSEWVDTFAEVREAGFSAVDITDSWIRPGDLSESRLDDLAQAAKDAGVTIPVISAIRRSVIDAETGDDNLAYSHRTIDAAAHLDMAVVSVGLHQALTPEQQKQLWFWTVEGHHDPEDDTETWKKTVSRLQELGRHAEEVGILLSLEMYEDTYLGTGDSSARLVQDIGMSNVGINPDVGNLVRLHRPIEDWYSVFEKTLPYSNYWHVKGYIRDEDVARDSYVAMPSPMESGLINYRDAFKLAIANGFQGIICAESYGGDGLSVCAANQDYLRGRILPKTEDYALGESKVTQRVVRATPSS